MSAEGYPVFNVQSIYYKDFLRATEPIIIVMRDSESFPRNGIAVRDSCIQKPRHCGGVKKSLSGEQRKEAPNVLIY